MRYQLNGKRRDVSCGAYPATSLAKAREKAKELRRLIDAGQDPMIVRAENAARAAEEAKKAIRFERVATDWFREEESGGRWEAYSSGGAREAKRVLRRLQIYVFPQIGEMPIDDVRPADIARCIQSIADKPATAEKVLGILRKVFSWASLRRLRTDGVNPASKDGAVGAVLDDLRRENDDKDNYPMCAVHEVPRFYRELLKNEGMSYRALQFLMLTAARSQAVRLAQWDEFNLDAGEWNIPPSHDKIKKKKAQRHIFLSKEAVDLLRSLPRFEGITTVFPSMKTNKAFSDMAMTRCIQRMHEKRLQEDGVGWIDPVKTKQDGKPRRITAHGFRASFRTWAQDDVSGNNRAFDEKAVEMCLLHKTDKKLNNAYLRGEYAEERRRIMGLWGRYCSTGKWPNEC